MKLETYTQNICPMYTFYNVTFTDSVLPMSYNLRMRVILGRPLRSQDATSIMQDRVSKSHLHYRETITVVKDK